jgi:thymidine phosphorylase
VHERPAPVQILERASTGGRVPPQDAAELTRAWLDGGADEAQMAALCALGWEAGSTATLVEVVLEAGDRLELARLGETGGIVSAGAVGDPSEIAAAVLAAAIGVRVAMLVGAAAGPVIGTEDKLGAIPGLKVGLAAQDVALGARDEGIVMGAPVGRLAAGYRRLARLAEGTGLARSPAVVAPLLAVRGLAAGPAALVVDVPEGPGAVLPEGTPTGEEVDAALTSRGRAVTVAEAATAGPLGPMIGTALEVGVVAEVLRGEGDERVAERAVALAGTLADLAMGRDDASGAAEARAALEGGAGLLAAERWVESQGGHPDVWTDPALLAQAPTQLEVGAPGAGTVAALDAGLLAETARWLGAGRLHPRQAIDFAAGVEVLVREGDRVEQGEPVLVLHGRAPDMVRAVVDVAATAVTVA